MDARTPRIRNPCDRPKRAAQRLQVQAGPAAEENGAPLPAAGELAVRLRVQACGAKLGP
jgi:hypothetical protein